MAVWGLLGVWLALGEMVRCIQALPPLFQSSGALEGKAAPLAEARPRSLCSEPLLGLLDLLGPSARPHMIGEH